MKALQQTAPGFGLELCDIDPTGPLGPADVLIEDDY